MGVFIAWDCVEIILVRYRWVVRGEVEMGGEVGGIGGRRVGGAAGEVGVVG